MQLEQDSTPLPQKPIDDGEFQGFISKYTRKVEQRDEPPQQEESGSEVQQTPSKKGMAERFEEKVAQDQ